MSNKFCVGLLSTIDSPLLPFFISGILAQGLKDIVVICDSKKESEKNKRIWLERTDGAFEKVDSGKANIYSLADARIPFYFVTSHNDQITGELINHLSIDALLNAGTPRKLSKRILTSVKYGVLNVHPGILPQYRGCSAVEWAIFNNDHVGNTAHFMTEGYDEGPIIISEWYEFPADTDYVSIRVRVYRDGCVLAGKALRVIRENKMVPSDGIPQNESIARYWNPIPNEKFEEVKKIVAEGRFLYQRL